MAQIFIHAIKRRVEYAIPVNVPDEVAKAAEDGDEDAWKTIAKAVERAYNPAHHWLDEDEFDPTDFEIMDAK